MPIQKIGVQFPFKVNVTKITTLGIKNIVEQHAKSFYPCIYSRRLHIHSLSRVGNHRFNARQLREKSIHINAVVFLVTSCTLLTAMCETV